MVSAFTINVDWKIGRSLRKGSADATLCIFEIAISGANVTTYSVGKGQIETHLQIPAYYVAEWIAHNWWAIFWEPAKSEDVDEDEEFVSRHSLLSAEHGFALPNTRLISEGEYVYVSARPRWAAYADARFYVGAETRTKRHELEEVLKGFVAQTVEHFGGNGTSPLEETWTLIRGTSDDEVEFCRLMGALGLSPYEEHTNVERALDSASKHLSKKQLMDLCLTSNHESIVRSAAAASILSSAFSTASEIDISILHNLTHPLDDDSGRLPHLIGYDAARRLRADMSVVEQDINGAARIFDKLNIDVESKSTVDLRGLDSPIAGSTRKDGDVGKIVLAREAGRRSRFAVARALYFLWTNKRKERRLITGAYTRDQKISRAFAAELLVPQSYVRSFAKGRALKREKILEIADLAGVGTDLVEKQATNSMLTLVN